ncbi:MAG: GNAT family N-acetyltransferase [Parachlamydiaceae bacterium]
MKYKCLKKNDFKIDNYQLIPIRDQDIENIRTWRNAQMSVLRQQKTLTNEDQRRYFQTSVWPTFEEESPSQLLFSFLFQDQSIGYGGLTRLDWGNRRAEVSFLVDPSRAEIESIYTQDFKVFLTILCKIAFEQLDLHRLVSETYAFRSSTLKVLEEVGFKREGVLREHVYKNGRWCDAIVLALQGKDWFYLESQIKEKHHTPSSCFFEKNMKRDSQDAVERGAVLITSISQKMPLIEAVRSAAKKSGYFQDIYGCDSNSQSIGQYGVDYFFHSPPLEEQKIEEIISYCLEHKISAIIPTRDDDVEFYARYDKALYQKGIHLMASPLETVSLCLDKKTFSDFLQQKKIPVIPTYLSLNEFESPYYVVKQRRGSGSSLLGIRLSKEKAIEYGRQLTNPIYQPFIEGQEWSVDVYRSFKGKVLGCVARQRNLVIEGESRITTTFRHPAIEELCMEMADRLNLYGHAVFQLIEETSGDLHVIECNPRFGGASTASIAVGLDSFFWFFAECLQVDLSTTAFKRAKTEVRQVRLMTDRIVPWSSYLI